MAHPQEDSPENSADDEDDESSAEESSSGESEEAAEQPGPKAGARELTKAKVEVQKPAKLSAPANGGVFETAAGTLSVGHDMAQPMILEAEPAEDLVVTSDAAGCESWIGQAIRSSQFVAIVRTPSAPAPTLIIEAPLAERFGLPLEVRQRPWVALRVRRRLGDPRVPLGVLNALCEQLVEAGVEPRTLVPVDSRSYLLIGRDRAQAAAAALVRAGHLVSPMSRLCSLEEAPVTDPEKLRPHVGAWRLLRRERGPSGSATVENFSLSAASLVTRGVPIRIQADNGFFVDFRVPMQPGSENCIAACFGTLSLKGGDAGKAVRHLTVSFQPPSGAPPPLQRVSFHGSGDAATVQEELQGGPTASSGPAGGILGERVVEKWARLAGGDQKVTVLELADQVPRSSTSRDSRRGAWLFCGKHFARVIGPPVGEGIVGTTCCRSLAQLEVLHGAETVRAELRKDYEAIVGEVERPGLLRIAHDAWDINRVGIVFYDAKAASKNGKNVGSVEVQLEDGFVQHRLPTGELQRWRIHDWAFDPFTPPPPPKPARAPSPAKDSDFDSSDEEDEEEQDTEENSCSDADSNPGVQAGSDSDASDSDSKELVAKKKKGGNTAIKAAANLSSSSKSRSPRGKKKDKKNKKVANKNTKDKDGKQKKGRSPSRKARVGQKEKEKTRHRSRSSSDRKRKKKKAKDKDKDKDNDKKDKAKQKEKEKEKEEKRRGPSTKRGRSDSGSRSRGRRGNRSRPRGKKKASRSPGARRRATSRSRRRSESGTRAKKDTKRKRSTSRARERRSSRNSTRKHKERSNSRRSRRSDSKSKKRSRSKGRKQRASPSRSPAKKSKSRSRKRSFSVSSKPRKQSPVKDTPAAKAAEAAKELEMKLAAEAQAEARQALAQIVSTKRAEPEKQKGAEDTAQQKLTAKDAEAAYLKQHKEDLSVVIDESPPSFPGEAKILERRGEAEVVVVTEKAPPPEKSSKTEGEEAEHEKQDTKTEETQALESSEQASGLEAVAPVEKEDVGDGKEEKMVSLGKHEEDEDIHSKVEDENIEAAFPENKQHGEQKPEEMESKDDEKEKPVAIEETPHQVEQDNQPTAIDEASDHAVEEVQESKEVVPGKQQEDTGANQENGKQEIAALESSPPAEERKLDAQAQEDTAPTEFEKVPPLSENQDERENGGSMEEKPEFPQQANEILEVEATGPESAVAEDAQEEQAAAETIAEKQKEVETSEHEKVESSAQDGALEAREEDVDEESDYDPFSEEPVSATKQQPEEKVQDLPEKTALGVEAPVENEEKLPDEKATAKEEPMTIEETKQEPNHSSEVQDKEDNKVRVVETEQAIGELDSSVEPVANTPVSTSSTLQSGEHNPVSEKTEQSVTPMVKAPPPICQSVGLSRSCPVEKQKNAVPTVKAPPPLSQTSEPSTPAADTADKAPHAAMQGTEMNEPGKAAEEKEKDAAPIGDVVDKPQTSALEIQPGGGADTNTTQPLSGAAGVTKSSVPSTAPPTIGPIAAGSNLPPQAPATLSPELAMPGSAPMAQLQTAPIAATGQTAPAAPIGQVQMVGKTQGKGTLPTVGSMAASQQPPMHGKGKGAAGAPTWQSMGQPSGVGGAHAKSRGPPPSQAASGPAQKVATTIGGASIPDLISAFVLQNNLNSEAEKTLRELPADIAVLVMRAGILPGENKAASLVQRVQKVVTEKRPNPQSQAQQMKAGSPQSQSNQIPAQNPQSQQMQPAQQMIPPTQQMPPTQQVPSTQQMPATQQMQLAQLLPLQMHPQPQQVIATAGMQPMTQQPGLQPQMAATQMQQPMTPAQMQQQAVQQQMTPSQMQPQMMAPSQMQPQGVQQQVAPSQMQPQGVHPQMMMQAPPPPPFQQQMYMAGQQMDPAQQAALVAQQQQAALVQQQALVAQQQQAAMLQQQQVLMAHRAAQMQAAQASATVGVERLTEFCRQNGVDAAVEQVLRGAPPDLQVRVMAEGPLVGGSSPSEVLIQRVKRMMGQTQA